MRQAGVSSCKGDTSPGQGPTTEPVYFPSLFSRLPSMLPAYSFSTGDCRSAFLAACIWESGWISRAPLDPSSCSKTDVPKHLLCPVAAEGARRLPEAELALMTSGASWLPLQAFWLCTHLSGPGLPQSGKGHPDFLLWWLGPCPRVSWVHYVQPFTADSWPRGGGGRLQGRSPISPALVTLAPSLTFREEHPARSRSALMWENVSRPSGHIHPPVSVSTGGARCHVRGRRQVWVQWSSWWAPAGKSCVILDPHPHLQHRPGKPPLRGTGTHRAVTRAAGTYRASDTMPRTRHSGVRDRGSQQGGGPCHPPQKLT